MAGSDGGVWMMMGLSLKQVGADSSQEQGGSSHPIHCRGVQLYQKQDKLHTKGAGVFALLLCFMFGLDLLIISNIYDINNS